MNKIMFTSGMILTIGTFIFMSVPSVTAQEPDPQFMARYDLDFDGKITKVEYKASGGNMEKWGGRDQDNNGILEGQELVGGGGKGGKKGGKGK